MPAPQCFVSDFKCCTGSVMAPIECKTIGFCFVWFRVSMFSLCTVSYHNSIHLPKTAFSWNVFTVHICLSWIVAFMDISLFFWYVRIGHTWGVWIWQRRPTAIAAVTQSCKLSAACRPQSPQPWHSTDSAVSQQLAHIRYNVVWFTLPVTVTAETPLCLHSRIPEHLLALSPGFYSYSVYFTGSCYWKVIIHVEETTFKLFNLLLFY